MYHDKSAGRIFHILPEAGMTSWEFLQFPDWLESKNLAESGSDVRLENLFWAHVWEKCVEPQMVFGAWVLRKHIPFAILCVSATVNNVLVNIGV